MKSLSRVWLFAIPWTVACQAPPSMGFSGKNTGVGCHFHLQGIFPTQGSNQVSCTAGRLYSLSDQGTAPRHLKKSTYYFASKLEVDNPSILLNYHQFCQQLLSSASSRYHWDYLLREKKKSETSLTIMLHDKQYKEAKGSHYGELIFIYIPKWQWTIQLLIF